MLYDPDICYKNFDLFLVFGLGENLIFGIKVLICPSIEIYYIFVFHFGPYSFNLGFYFDSFVFSIYFLHSSYFLYVYIFMLLVFFFQFLLYPMLLGFFYLMFKF